MENRQPLLFADFLSVNLFILKIWQIADYVVKNSLFYSRNSVFAVKWEESHHTNDHQQIKFPQKFEKEVVKWMKIFDRDLNRKQISKDFFFSKNFSKHNFNSNPLATFLCGLIAKKSIFSREKVNSRKNFKRVSKVSSITIIIIQTNKLWP